MSQLNKLLNVNRKKNRLVYLALFIGLCLLFFSIQMYWSTFLLINQQVKKSKFEYLVVNKTITNRMMGNESYSYFTKEEIEELQKQKTVEQIGLIESNQFSIEAKNFGDLAFSTQLFFEAIPNHFIDTDTAKFVWEHGSKKVPVILSLDFLNLYNFGFALSQGLPQLSEETLKSISFQLIIQGSEEYTAEIIGFSQRYSSVMIPISFMRYANQKFGKGNTPIITRIVLQTMEPDNPELTHFLNNHQYQTQQDKIKWSSVKTIVNIIFSTSGLFSVFILSLCFFLLLLYLKLLIVESAEKLKLLLLLGYQKKNIQIHFVKPILKKFILVVMMALISTQIFQIALSLFLAKLNYTISYWIPWFVILLAAISVLFIYSILLKKSEKIINSYFD